MFTVGSSHVIILLGHLGTRVWLNGIMSAMGTGAFLGAVAQKLEVTTNASGVSVQAHIDFMATLRCTNDH